MILYSGKIQPLLILSIVGVFCTQCHTDECFKGTGTESQKYVETGYFREVNVCGIFDVILVEDTACFLVFEGGSDMLKQTSTENIDSILWIGNSNSCYFLKDFQKVKLYLHFNNIDAVNLKDACTVRTQSPIRSVFRLTSQGEIADIDIELNNEHFFFYNHHTSSGIFVFRGRCTNCTIYGYYTGKVDASMLNTKNITIENHSITDYSVRAEESVHAKIFDRGNIYVHGNPVIYVDSIAGSGKVFKASD